MKTASKETGRGSKGTGKEKGKGTGKSRALENFWGACRVLRAAIAAYNRTADRAENVLRPEHANLPLSDLVGLYAEFQAVAIRERVMVAAQDHVGDAEHELRCALVASGMEAA